MSGRATVAAFTINRQPWIPGFGPPYLVAMVELAEERDVRLVSNVVDIAVEEVRIGLEVEVFFEDWPASGGQERSDPGIDGSGDEEFRVWLPLFRPLSS